MEFVLTIANLLIILILPLNMSKIYTKFFEKKCFFFLLFYRHVCKCSNKLNISLEFSEYECDHPCPGNSSQICGGYFGPSSVYEIFSKLKFSFKNKVFFYSLLTLDIEVKINCSNLTYINQAHECDLTYHSPFNQSINFDIYFGDTHFQNISIQNSKKVIISKIYEKTGIYKMFLESKEMNLILNPEFYSKSLEITKNLLKSVKIY